MSQVQEARFACEGCKKTYRWKPELAGKKVKCKCGTVMICPQTEPGGGEAPDDLYDLCPDTETPKKKPAAVARQPAQPVVPAKGMSKPTSPVLGYAGSTRFKKEEVRAREENALGGPAWREMYVPAAMVLLGLLLQVVATTYMGKGKWLAFDRALPQIGFRLGVDLVLSSIGIFFVIKMFEVAIGSPGPAVLKMAAICLLVPGLSGVLGMLIGADSDFVRMMVASMLTFPLGFVAFKVFFDMEFADAIYCVIIVSLVNDWAMTFLLGMVFSGGGL
jgi:hypothetical protein